MARKLDKFFLLLWKNWLTQYRKPIQTAIEILAPVLFSILLVLIRRLIEPKEHANTIFQPFSIVPERYGKLFAIQEDGPKPFFEILYTPNKLFLNDKFKAIEDEIATTNILNIDFIAFDDVAALEKYYMQANSTFAALQFDQDIEAFGPETTVHIRFPSETRQGSNEFGDNNWQTNLLFPIFQTPGPRTFKNDTGAFPYYANELFLLIQYFTSSFVNDVPPLDMISNYGKIKMQRFPYGRWQEDPLITILTSFAGMLILLSFVYTCINTVKSITVEKEKQLKEAMKIMGLPGWLHWTAWFIKCLMFLIVSIILITILLNVRFFPESDYSVLTKADPTLVFVFLLAFVCATITFCFAVSTFFSKANTAGTVAGFAWFLSYAPYLFMQNNYATTSLASKLLASLGSNTAMAYGFQLLLMYEGTGDGAQWSTLFTPNTQDDTLSLGLIIIMLIIDTVLYLLIALYVEAVFPGDYGVAQPWYFIFTAKYWCGTSRFTGTDILDESEAPINNEFFEADPRNLRTGIRINNLRKVFGKKAAVRNLTLNMYEDQITVLLGHNGAGKTTTMSMLTGMFTPTSGTAMVNGHNIRTDIGKVRESLGLCPQHNILFDDLTVSEHIYFFSKLKGLEKHQIQAEINKYLTLLELQPKAHAKSATLSGGMKRKLCVCIALCGNSKVVLLDEPTAGMDPSARRALWDLVQSQKKTRTVLLTTHFMDEADILGDRIAIMAGGELQCCGSSFFLKKKYGAGYHLIMEKSARCDVHKVTQLLRQYIPEIEMEGTVGSELTYSLPESQAGVFEGMLQSLESQSSQLGVDSYGISLTTLEEVFMKVGADHGQEEKYNEGNAVLPSRVLEKNMLLESSWNLNDQHIELLEGFSLIKNQFFAMFMKKILAISRTWVLQLIQISMPVLFLIIALVVNQIQSADLPAMPIKLSSYDDSITLIQAHGEPHSVFSKYSDGINYRIVENITSEMIQKSTSEPSSVRRNYIIGATLTNDVNTAWFNNDPYHTPPLALQQLLNAVLDKKVNIVNNPLPASLSSKIKKLSTGNNMGFQVAFNIGFSMAFVSSFYVLFYSRERVCQSKHLQFVSGANAIIFWTTSFICDLLTFVATGIAVTITLVCFQEDGFSSPAELARFFVALMYFGWSMLPMMYLASHFFDVPSTGFTRMTLFSVFTGNVAFIVVQILQSPGLDLENVGDPLHWLFLIIPHYSLVTGIRDCYVHYGCDLLINLCLANNRTPAECFAGISSGSICQDAPASYYAWEYPGIGRNLFFSIIVGSILFVLLVLKDSRVFTGLYTKIISRNMPSLEEQIGGEDDDVLREKQKVRNSPERELFEENVLLVKNLTKYYKKHLAVNSLCLGVKKSQCFGLLGINGAGKTTTFKMMTGDIPISYGDAWVNGSSVQNNLKQVQKFIGYCPQFDALLDDLTVRETLRMFALLRGIPWNYCDKLADKLSHEFDFHRHMDKKVKELSGGNKRKLSTSIALIGDPPVMYLDEPTTGMDPATKRYLWNAICRVRDNGKCIILTSHSMEECEALCTRLAIMVNGNFKCLGSTQHLKHKFADGYTLTIKIKRGSDNEIDTSQLESFVRSKFPCSILREKHQDFLTFYITDKSVLWSKMFGILERAKRSDLNIEDYSLGQCSLEQVFLSFTKYQDNFESP